MLPCPLGLLSCGSIPRQLAILAQPDLEEDEAGRKHEPEPDQHEREHLAKRAAKEQRPDDARNDKCRGDAEPQDP